MGTADRDVSVLIASRNEMWLRRTIENVLENSHVNTEVIAVLDGAWAAPPLEDHPDVRLVYLPQAIGQRAGVNLAARLSRARFVMKLDAHCTVSPGFDAVLMADCDRDWTVVSRQYNLHAFDRKCKACGALFYQGPLNIECPTCHEREGFERIIVWKPRTHEPFGDTGSVDGGKQVRTDFARFDHELHFQYWRRYGRRPEAAGEIADLMTSVGCFFFMHRDRFWELGGLDEDHGSWGQFGVEIALKSWLSGGRHVVNTRCWHSHLFRTQGGDFGFPYPMRGRDQENARKHSRRLWLENQWPGQVLPLSWLLDKFQPVPGWHEAAAKKEQPAAKLVRDDTLATVTARGHSFVNWQRQPVSSPSVGLLYYSSGQGDPALLEAVRDQIRGCRDAELEGAEIVSVTLEPLDFGTNVVVEGEVGQLAMFRQILAGLEALSSSVVFHVEHDVLYHPTHFRFRPPRTDRYFYNQNRYQVDAETGRAVHYLCCQTSGLVADRALLLAHYRRRVELIEAEGYHRNLGYEPGTNSRSRAIDGVRHDVWMSEYPNLDVRHGKNLTSSRWSRDEFRNKSTCLGWTEVEEIPGWGRVRDNFAQLVAQRRMLTGVE